MVYKWIWESKHSNRLENLTYKTLHKELTHGMRCQKRGNIIDNRASIKNRVHTTEWLAIIEQREWIGDLQADLMFGENQKSYILAFTDRVTLITMIRKTEEKNGYGGKG